MGEKRKKKAPTDYTADEIQAALDKNKGNVSKTARELNVNHMALRRRLDSLKMSGTDSKIKAVIQQAPIENESSNSPLSRALAEQALANLITDNNLKATTFYLSAKCGYAPLRPVQKPYTEDEQKTVSEVLTKLKNKEINAIDAGLDLTIAGITMPDVLTMLISKTEMTPAEAADNNYSIFTDADFARRMEERSREIHSQLDGLPTRRQEIEALRASTADSFTAEETGNEDS